MTKREEEKLMALLAKKEAEEKADREFFRQCRKRKTEVLKALEVDAEAIQQTAELVERLLKVYGKEATVENFRDYVTWIEHQQKKDVVQNSIPISQ